MKIVSALIAGLIFGFGLAISGMADPAKVLNFLDVFGAWDPSLAFVMGGAIAVTLPGYAMIKRARSQPVFGGNFSWPTKTDLDGQLIGGSAMFGLGWGLGGFCPGPALTAIPLAAPGTLIFVVTMLIGMALAHIVKNRIAVTETSNA